MLGTDFEPEDVAPRTFTQPLPPWEFRDETPEADHVVSRPASGVLVACPVAPNDPQPPYTGRCPTCGTSLSGRTVEAVAR